MYSFDQYISQTLGTFIKWVLSGHNKKQNFNNNLIGFLSRTTYVNSSTVTYGKMEKSVKNKAVLDKFPRLGFSEEERREFCNRSIAGLHIYKTSRSQTDKPVKKTAVQQTNQQPGLQRRREGRRLFCSRNLARGYHRICNLIKDKLIIYLASMLPFIKIFNNSQKKKWYIKQRNMKRALKLTYDNSE